MNRYNPARHSAPNHRGRSAPRHPPEGVGGTGGCVTPHATRVRAGNAPP